MHTKTMKIKGKRILDLAIDASNDLHYSAAKGQVGIKSRRFPGIKNDSKETPYAMSIQLFRVSTLQTMLCPFKFNR